jgi:hypothetical protein
VTDAIVSNGQMTSRYETTKIRRGLHLLLGITGGLALWGSDEHQSKHLSLRARSSPRHSTAIGRARVAKHVAKGLMKSECLIVEHSLAYWLTREELSESG